MRPFQRDYLLMLSLHRHIVMDKVIATITSKHMQDFAGVTKADVANIRAKSRDVVERLEVELRDAKLRALRELVSDLPKERQAKILGSLKITTKNQPVFQFEPSQTLPE